MASKRDLIIAVLATFCLTATLFTTVPIRSQSTGGYDPWKDLNDDGVIDSTDLGMLGTSWATTGNPVNKTDLLYNVNQTLTELLSRIDQLNITLTELQSRIKTLETLLPPNKIRILPIDLVPKSDLSHYDRGPWGMIADGSYFATIKLPDGVVVKNMSAMVYDKLSGPYQIKISLNSIPKYPPGGGTLASILFNDPGAPGLIIKYDDTIDNPIIDNKNYDYYVEVWFELCDVNYELRWIEIEYEYQS